MEPLFGDLFDLDGDGYATMEEELMGMAVLEQLRRDMERRQRMDEPWHEDEAPAWDGFFWEEEDME